MRAEIVSIGTELLLGEITDTNSAYIAGQLPALGLDLYFMSTVGDNQQRIVNILKQACERSDIVITTGGLGPTQDDITREAIAELAGEQITINQTLVSEFTERFKYYKLDMPLSNIKQAGAIPSAQIISNPRGTAPGWWVEKNNRIIIAMPGPPREMQLMWTREVAPRLQQILKGPVILSRTVKTFGLSEAKVDEVAAPFLSSENPTIGTYAKPDGIHLRITAKAETIDEALQMIDRREADIRGVLDNYCWGIDSDNIETIAGSLLTARNLSLATMESQTGGILADVITNVPGSAKYYKGGMIAHDAEASSAFGLDDKIVSQYGMISAESAAAMSTIARQKLHADIGVGLTGVMGPAEIEGKPVGTIFLAIDDGKQRQSYARNHPGSRTQIKQRAVSSTLFELRKTLLGLAGRRGFPAG